MNKNEINAKEASMNKNEINAKEVLIEAVLRGIRSEKHFADNPEMFEEADSHASEAWEMARAKKIAERIMEEAFSPSMVLVKKKNKKKI